MHPPVRRCHGYSLIELLLVLAILSILAIAGVSRIGNRTASSVRGVMDEMEGALLGAQKLAVATGQNVTIATQGAWDPKTPLFRAQAAGMTPTDTLANGQNAASSFRLALTPNGAALAREHLNAGIVVVQGTGSTWWSDAQGGNDDITTQEPFLDQPGFTGIFKADPVTGAVPNLFQGSLNSVTISGTNKRFNTTFWVEVVSLHGGAAVPGGPMGLLVVQGNGATVYKYYTPGIINGNGHWRRL
jgi:prepilin-type N-terminal cleavage/methylation domain-containing protein